MDLLVISDNIAIPSPYVLTIKEFAKITERKNSIKEFSYIYHMCDHSSPFALYDIDKREEEVIKNLFSTKWKADKTIKAACDKYLELKEEIFSIINGLCSNIDDPKIESDLRKWIQLESATSELFKQAADRRRNQ